MAQQTQISRVVEAWRRFVTRFPTIDSLAAATPADVLRAWQGMGYDRRALNLRDRHCQWAGCTVPAEECVSHHHQHFADGGPTTEANLGLYCIVHHAMLHPENDCYRRAP